MDDAFARLAAWVNEQLKHKPRGPQWPTEPVTPASLRKCDGMARFGDTTIVLVGARRVLMVVGQNSNGDYYIRTIRCFHRAIVDAVLIDNHHLLTTGKAERYTVISVRIHNLATPQGEYNTDDVVFGYDPNLLFCTGRIAGIHGNLRGVLLVWMKNEGGDCSVVKLVRQHGLGAPFHTWESMCEGKPRGAVRRIIDHHDNDLLWGEPLPYDERRFPVPHPMQPSQPPPRATA